MNLKLKRNKSNTLLYIHRNILKLGKKRLVIISIPFQTINNYQRKFDMKVDILQSDQFATSVQKSTSAHLE